MSKFAAYAIVNGKAVDFDAAQKSLATHVELQLIKGWTLQGGVIFTGVFTEPDGITYLVFSQALFKPAMAENEEA